MKRAKTALVSWLTFGGVFLLSHLIWVAIQILFFGATGKSSHSADFVIFGVMLGTFFAGACSLGYGLANVLPVIVADFSVRIAVRTAIGASVFSYGFFAAGYLLEFERYVGGEVDGLSALSLSLLGAVSAVLFSAVTVLWGKVAHLGRAD